MNKSSQAKTAALNTSRHWKRKSKNLDGDKAFHDPGLAELILWEWQYHQK